MPVIFVGHGSPMNAIEDNEFSRTWKEMGKIVPKPEAIVAISAHWQSEGIKVTGSNNPKQIYDFYGFPNELYQKKYPTKGSVDLAKEVAEICGAKLDETWGIDHGTWSVLAQMFPKANIPVIQLSLDVGLSPKEHWQVAEKLQELREEKVLILGSGNVIHNLGMVQWNDNGYDWAIKFDGRIKELIESEDFETLINYKNLEDSELAIPTNEHYLPLLYILALKNKEESIKFLAEKVTMGSLSMRSIIIGQAE